MRHSRIKTAVVVAAVVIVAAAATAAGDRLPARKLTPQQAARLPGGAQALERESVRQRISGERWRQVHDLIGDRHVSRRDDVRRHAKARDAAATDTLRVLLVRIGFDTDRSGDLTSVTEDGEFQLGPPPTPAEDPLPIDPSPHDRAYFESHLHGLSEYYKFQSGGRLHIEGRVLPEGDRDSYHLSDIADYGPGAGNFWTLEGLERLVRDIITTADAGTQADGSADFSDYDDAHPFTYIIFTHAGSDWQSDVNQDSPNDIPTFFVTLGDSVPLLSGGALRECSIIPETTSQDGYRGSIAAALYHEFGHALGLPDVYDATTGLTATGVWDLMDSGTNLAANIGVDTDDDGAADTAIPVTGVLPPSLSAWCKWFLGWVDLGTLSGDARTVQLPAVGVRREDYGFYAPSGDFDAADPQVLVAGASSREFFLIENRWVPLQDTDTPFDPYNPVNGTGGLYFQSDPTTGVILYLGGDVRGEPRNSGLYDYFMPEGGLLVWHVNMDRIEAGLPTNTINRYGDGLKLVEADGIQDIGVLDSYVLGWYGSARDPFTPYNPDGALALEPTGRPHSRAWDRSLTGVHLWDIRDDGDAHGAVMRFDGRVEPLAGAFPFTLDDAADGPRALEPTSLTNVGGVTLLAGAPAALFAITPAGAPAFPAAAEHPTAWAWDLTDALAGPLVVVDGGVVAATRDGQIARLRVEPGVGLSEAWREAAGDTVVAGPLVASLTAGTVVVCATGAGSLVALAGDDGRRLGETLVLPGATALAASPRLWLRPDDATVVCFDTAGWYEAVLDADGFAGAAQFHAYGTAAAMDAVHPALIPGVDDARLVIPEVGAWQLAPGGSAQLADWRARLEGPLVGDPAVADLDGDGRHDLVAVTAHAVWAWQPDGTVLAGFPATLANLFPLPDSTRFAGGPVVADATGDGLNEILVTTHTGHLLGVTAAGQLLGGTPYRFGDVGDASLAVGMGAGEGARTLYLASAGGYSGPPFARHRTNGRIVGYRLPYAGAPGTSEWRGILGGGARSGPEGTLRALGPLSPLAAAETRAIVYPSPVRGHEATVRFAGLPGSEARLTVLNLEGEEVLRLSFAAGDGPVSEHTFPLDIASGLYLCRLEWEGSQGPARTVAPLAVER